MERKELLLNNLKDCLISVRTGIDGELVSLVEEEKNLLVQVRRAFNIDQEIAAQQLVYTRRRIEELTTLKSSPFFAKVTYLFDSNKKEVYISKYEFSVADVNNISSWTSPVSELRFEDLGKATLHLPEKKIKGVDLIQKDSYVIGQDKVVYYSQETAELGVEIIYEDFLSTVKSEFGLSEIISKIEKEQYKIIQSKPKGSLIISGPAGSGKTTICLHRVAYLLQRPETSELYDGKKLLMLVQDASTKDYFSSILPKLGIPNMYVETYFNFGSTVLGLSNVIEVSLHNVEEVYLEYIEEKLNIINKHKVTSKRIGKDIVGELERLYKKQLSERHYQLFINNLTQNSFDYLDITIMLSMTKDEEGDICIEEELHKPLRNGKYKVYTKFTKVNYGMVIVDEFQNYSADQIAVIRNLVDKETKSLVYIGDRNQKSLLRPESKVSPYDFEDCLNVELNKVYRNTKQILEYIQSCGYNVEIPENAREGNPVMKFTNENETSLIETIRGIINDLDISESVGVLCDTVLLKKKLDLALLDITSVRNSMRIMTKIESQGTEFNSVITINGGNGNFEGSTFETLLKVTQRNADYIGYTRAVEKLFVISYA
jgi:DNA helicase IV